MTLINLDEAQNNLMKNVFWTFICLDFNILFDTTSRNLTWKLIQMDMDRNSTMWTEKWLYNYKQK